MIHRRDAVFGRSCRELLGFRRLGVGRAQRALYRRVASPIARARTKGAWHRGWRLVGIDGGTWDVADTPESASNV